MGSFRYPERAAQGGRLFYRDSIPVLETAGGPEAVGRQVGELALGPARRLLDYPLDYLRSQVRIPPLARLAWALLRRPCRRLFRNIPAEYRAEVEAMAGPDRDRLVMANTLFDLANTGLRPLFGCSSLATRSAAGRLLLGRNLDFCPLGYLHEYSLVTVYRPGGGRPGWASVGFPGMVGCFSGMNAAGLCAVRHEVLGVRGRRVFDPAGVPFAAALRAVLETCRTVDEAVERLTHTRHATVNLVVLADPHAARVAELTPAGVFVRPTGGGVIGCTNHFLDPRPRPARQANLYQTLDRQAELDRFAAAAGPAVGVGDVWAALGRVHQGELTIQSMVFDPAARTIHVAFGPGPTTALEPVRLDLANLLA